MKQDNDIHFPAPAPAVLLGIRQVIEAFSQNGIAKNHKNESQGFKFRGVDDVLNRMGQELVAAHLVIVPNISKREVYERTNSRGNPIFFVSIEVDYTIYSTLDGSSVTCRAPGEAMDSGDKATNKALSIAYKYMAFQLFAIPIAEDPDRESPRLGTSKPIAKDELALVKKLLAEAEFAEEKLLAIYEVEALEALPQMKLPEITAKLQQKIAGKTKPQPTEAA